jgi:pimeloyl-ACP methyl ester carboxylesterase
MRQAVASLGPKGLRRIDFLQGTIPMHTHGHWEPGSFQPHGITLRYVRGPRAGRPLALLHGVLRAWNAFLPLMSPLAARYELWALDQRGHGDSDRATTGYRVDDYVNDATAWLRQVIRQPVVLYGHSLGAMVAAGVAAAAPDLVQGAILEDPPFQTLGRRMAHSGWQDYFRALAELAGSQDSLARVASRLGEVRLANPHTGVTVRLADVRDAVALRFFAASLRRVDPRVLDSVVDGRWLEGYDDEQVFASIRCPVLLLQADLAAGGMLADEDVQRVGARAENCLHMRMANTGHMMHWQRTQEIANLVFGFMESLGQDDPS